MEVVINSPRRIPLRKEKTRQPMKIDAAFDKRQVLLMLGPLLNNHAYE